jgi:hypothetical protein
MKSLRTAILGCCIMASACYQGDCGPTGPSETAGSHANEPGRTITIGLQYSIAAGATPSWQPDPQLAIAAGRAGAHTVALQTLKVVTVEDVKTNEAFPVAARGGFIGTCNWSGTTRVAAVDLTVIVRPHVSTPDTYLLTCL